MHRLRPASLLAALLLCVASAAQAANVPTYRNSSGRPVDATGVVCLSLDANGAWDGTYNECGGGGSSNTEDPIALLTNASSTGSPVSGVAGGSYIWSCTGTFNGATLTLQTLGPNGSTYVTVTTMTSASNTGVVIGNNATVRVSVSGSPSAMYCTIS